MMHSFLSHQLLIFWQNIYSSVNIYGWVPIVIVRIQAIFRPRLRLVPSLTFCTFASHGPNNAHIAKARFFVVIQRSLQTIRDGR